MRICINEQKRNAYIYVNNYIRARFPCGCTTLNVIINVFPNCIISRKYRIIKTETLNTFLV